MLNSKAGGGFMDEDLNRESDGGQKDGGENKEGFENNDPNVNAFGMENIGNVRNDGGNRSIGEAAAVVNPKTYVILGWISSALTLLVSPYFVILAVIFGVLANRQIKGRGNAIIITGVIFAVVNLIFSFFLAAMIRPMLY